jgi:2-polyprenyl-3-methyl-5-hydroxy-6-metoxy-1,4-benzoquinol methylase
MVNRDAVIFAYRLLFGREPESEAVITHYATEVTDVNQLRELFMNSTEFRENLEKMQTPRPPRLPFNGPAMDVELTASTEKLAALFIKTANQWEHLGETQPHWSVLTNESYFQENFHQNSDAFYASGEAELTQFDATLNRAKINSHHFKRCVELGCGVGRVTIPLAQRFEQVTALDISQAHLSVAKHYANEKAIHHISFEHLSQIGAISQMEEFDVLYSRIVLQHNSPPVMVTLLNQLLAKLRPGGVAFFQIPTYKAGYRFCIEDYLAQENTTAMEMHFFPQTALFELITNQHCRLLEIREDDAIGLSVTAVSNTILVQKNLSA